MFLVMLYNQFPSNNQILDYLNGQSIHISGVDGLCTARRLDN